MVIAVGNGHIRLTYRFDTAEPRIDLPDSFLVGDIHVGTAPALIVENIGGLGNKPCLHVLDEPFVPGKGNDGIG